MGKQCKATTEEDCLNGADSHTYIFPCSWDASKEEGHRCFIDEADCAGKDEGSECPSVHGVKGKCTKLIQPGNNGTNHISFPRAGPLFCRTCGQVGGFAISKESCCT